MKGYYKLLFVFIIMFLLTGCMKANFNMTINKDKSMNLDIIYAFNDSLIEQDGSSVDFNDESENFKKAGFTVTGYKKDGMTGIEAIKKFKNIDEISSNKDVIFDLNSIRDGNKVKEIFKVKKGIFKNHYYATTKADTSAATKGNNQRQLREEDSNDLTADYSSMMSGMDLTFVVNVPYKAINNNATSVENDGKTLKWDLTKVKGDMTFEFSLLNLTNIYIAGGIGLVIIIIVLSSIITSGKSNKPTIATELKTVTPSVIDHETDSAPIIDNDQPNTTPPQAPTNQTQQSQFVNTPNQGVNSNIPNTNSSEEKTNSLNDLYN